MAELTIHDIDDSLMEQLCALATKEECSVEELISSILREVYADGAIEPEPPEPQVDKPSGNLIDDI